ncbi:uncharacterized protein LOC134221693 [Armigeres subalbatus]|uniref:uncharacterized protein LOC134221693 n=1 Tax=Armigeres subalbatus TaxID=124917 RepID=UPI002ED38D26
MPSERMNWLSKKQCFVLTRNCFLHVKPSHQNQFQCQKIHSKKEAQPKCQIPKETTSSGTIQALRQLAGEKGVPLSGNKEQLKQRLQWYDTYNLNSSIIEPVEAVKPLDDSGFIEDLAFFACDEVLQQSLGWLSVVEIFSYFQQRSARQGYRNGKLLQQAGFLRNVCYAKVCICAKKAF